MVTVHLFYHFNASVCGKIKKYYCYGAGKHTDLTDHWRISLVMAFCKKQANNMLKPRATAILLE